MNFSLPSFTSSLDTMDDYKSDQNYGSTISFSIVRSNFDDLPIDSPTQTIVRAFDKVVSHTGVHGHWCCVFEEIKRQHRSAVELYLSLNWVVGPDPSDHPSSQEASSSSFIATTDRPAGQKNAAHQAREFIRRIRSVKIRSDSTLSELLVAPLDGACLLHGEFIKGKKTRSDFATVECSC